MIGLSDPRLCLAVLLMAVGAFFGGAWYEQRVSTARMALADGNAKTALEAATTKAKVAEKALASEHIAIDAVRTKEKQDAKATIDTLRADVRSGAISLSIATRALRAGTAGPDTSAGYLETRSELVPAAAIALIDIAADGDDAVRDLNACIANYDAVRRATNP